MSSNVRGDAVRFIFHHLHQQPGCGPGLRQCVFLIFFLLLVWPPSGSAALHPREPLLEYRLQVSFDLPQGKVLGRATILAPQGHKLTIDPGKLNILAIRHRGQTIASGRRPGKDIVIYVQGPIQVEYEASLGKTGDNAMDQGDIILLSRWYPQVEGFCRFKLSATLPSGYLAVSEADHVTRNKKNGQTEFIFDFPHPLDDGESITLTASKRWVVSQASQNNVELLTYLFPEDAHLAPRYLDRSRHALAKYEQLLGPYPYRRLVVIENSFQVSQAQPTYILMEQGDFLREDFGRNPLDHEIVHQWFGCAVSSNYDQGNWCEGLATYLSNYLIREEKGLDRQWRHHMLSYFQTHTEGQREFPLRNFTERFDNLSRAIGYCKAAMVFHMLRRQVGDQAFFEALRSFFKTDRFAVASWDDLRRSFEAQTKQDFSWFFRQWVDGTGQPQIRIERGNLEKDGQGYVVHLALSQEGPVKRLSLPVRLYGPGNSRIFQVVLSRRTEEFTFRLDFQPEKVIIDENYDVFRKLAPAGSGENGNEDLSLILRQQYSVKRLSP
jgi:aminopeptidase N